MAKTFKKARDEIGDRIHALFREAQHLGEKRVTVGVLEVTAGDEDVAPALKRNGRYCAALVRPTPADMRAQGEPDAIAYVDTHWYENASVEEHEAVFDRLVYSLMPKTDRYGDWKYDQHMRPLLKIRLEDIYVVGYQEIIERHGLAAVEAKALRVANERLRQLQLRWGDDNGDPDPAPTVSLDGPGPDRPGGMAGDVLDALLSVGFEEPNARRMIDLAFADGNQFESVAEAIDHIYALADEAESADPPDKPKAKKSRKRA